MRKTTLILAALALSALATTGTFAQRDGGGGGQRGGGGAPAGGGGGQGGRGATAPMPMSFFITSTPKGDGANYGGLAGADAYCQQMAMGAGRGGVTWHAYLSQQAKGGMPAVNARDRIGSGPWYNQRGQMVARDLGVLHGDTIDQARVGNALGKQISLNDKGMPTNGVGDMPNQHDILTGSRPDGTAFPDEADHTCNNYTSNADTGSVQLGHADKQGGNNSSWNSAHASAGCSQPKLVQTGGAGLLYCFAVN
jgi:hypothetical protein